MLLTILLRIPVHNLMSKGVPLSNNGYIENYSKERIIITSLNGAEITRGPAVDACREGYRPLLL